MPVPDPLISPNQSKGRVSIVQPNRPPLSPTSEAYGALQFSYDYFNKRLFNGRLPPVLFTLTRNPRSLGYFAPERFENADGVVVHEISLNPQYLEAKGDYNALNTLVHEQCHVSRHEFGPRNKKGQAGTPGYHDRAWADEMLRIGLVPSDTGEPEGKQTGVRMSDYPAPNGPFDLAARELLIAGFMIDWRDSVPGRSSKDADNEGRNGARPQRARRGGPTRATFACPACQLKALAKPSALFACIPCRAPMTVVAS